MASFSLITQLFPDGTTVAAYSAEGIPNFPAVPPGSPVAEAVVSGAKLTFEGLDAHGQYFAAAKVNGSWRSTRFTVGQDGPPPNYPADADFSTHGPNKVLSTDSSGDGFEFVDAGTQAELNAHNEDTTSVHGISDTSKLALKSEVDAVNTQLDNLAIYNVKDYGAKGDGTTDDTTAIKEATEAANGGALVSGDYGDEGSAEGSLVYFPPGTYLSKKITLGSGIVLAGAGKGSTKIKLKDETNDNLIETLDWSTLQGKGENKGPHRFGIRDLTLSGNSANQTKGHGIAIYGRSFHIHRVHIGDTKEDGIYTEWQAGGIEAEGSFSQVIVRSVKGNGINFLGPHDSFFHQCMVEHPGEGKTGIWTHQGTAAGALFEQCHVFGEAHKVSWQIDQNAYLTDCQGEGASDTQLHINGSQTVVLGGHFYGTGEEEDESTSIRLGTAEENFPGSLRINTRASKAKLCVKFEQEGSASTIVVTCVPREGGTVSEGTPDSKNHVLLLTEDEEETYHQLPSIWQEVASASPMTLSRGCQIFEVNGTTEIKKITASYAGHLVVLKFASNPTVKDGENLSLAGDFTASAKDTLTLICDSVDWHEVARSVN